MVDHSKRKALKNAVRVGVGVAVATAAGHAAAHLDSLPELYKTGNETLQDNDLTEIEIATRHSTVSNDVEIVITNRSNATTSITNMTPAEINTARGKFDINALFYKGAVQLDAGQSITVPMQHHRVSLNASGSTARTFPLSKCLKQNVSIITDGDSLAAVSFVNRTGHLV